MAGPTYESTNENTTFGSQSVPAVIGDDKTRNIITALQGYMQEASENRKAGLNPRDDKWKENLDLYWGRYDFSRKANWQAKEVMPEVAGFVDRFAAALKEALIAIPEGFYTVVDPGDKEGDLANAIKRMTDAWLSSTGRNQTGQLLPYSATFEEQMKLGALMATSSVTTWKTDVPNGRVAIETVDPRFVWLDHTYRNLYRIRRIELDSHELPGLANSKDNKGHPIFNIPELSKLVGKLALDSQQRKEELTGSGAQVTSNRKPIVLDEYIATVVNAQGEKIADRSLMVLAENEFLIRGPEKNPFWHEKDWLSYAPLITAPLSVYGRSYMEDFGSLAHTFNELTNMILDAVHTSALKAFAMVPGMLLNPNQAAEGLHPNKLFLLEDGYKADDFAKALDLGALSPDAVAVWKAMKSELTEAAKMNEIGLGQFAPKGRTSATEVTETQQSSSALLRSVAQTVETRHLDPTLDLVWKTGLQHVSAKDQTIANAVGPDMYAALISRRKELIQRPVTFQARGISTIIQRGQMLKSLMGVLSVIAQSPQLMQSFFAKTDPEKLYKKIFELSNIDISSVQLSEREQMIRSVMGPIQQAQQQAAGGAAPGQQGGNEMGDVTNALGIGR
jgi:hypothetical protein